MPLPMPRLAIKEVFGPSDHIGVAELSVWTARLKTKAVIDILDEPRLS